MVALPVILTPPPSSSSPMPLAKRKAYGLSADTLPSIARRALGSAKLGWAPTDLTVKPLVPPVTVTWAWPLARLVTHVPGAKVPWRYGDHRDLHSFPTRRSSYLRTPRARCCAGSRCP